AGVVWVNPTVNALTSKTAPYYDLAGGLTGVGLGGGNSYWVNQTGDGVQSPIYHTSDPSVSPYFVWGYSAWMNALVINQYGGIPTSGNLWVVYMQRALGTEVPVADIIRDICERAGIDDASIDVTKVLSTTIGYAIMEESTFGKAIGDLCQTYQIDVVE